MRKTIFNKIVYENIGYNVDNRKERNIFSPEKILYIIRIRRETTRAQRIDRNLFGRRDQRIITGRGDLRNFMLILDNVSL